MMWIIVCLAAVMAGFIMWDGISPELPEMLQLSGDKEAPLPAVSPTVAPAPAQALARSITSANWSVGSDGRNLRASREFHTPILSGTTHYYPPVLHLSCFDGNLYAWVDAGLTPLQATGKPGLVAVRVNSGPQEYWATNPEARIIAPNPAALLSQLSKGTELTLTLGFVDAPTQALRLRANGLEAILAPLSSCR